MLTYQSIVKRLKARGFNYLKLELEAQVGISSGDHEACQYCEEGQVECSNCEGEGTLKCTKCNGNGERQLINRKTHQPFGSEVECPSCEGNGNITCSNCDGDGRVTCQECNGDYESKSNGDLESFQEDFSDKLDCLGVTPVYMKVYNDGTVDTEATLTIKVEDITEVENILIAFRDLCHNYGDCETDYAGLHITVMETSDYNSLSSLPSVKIENFKREVAKLVPCLYLLASENGERTRSTHFRMPQISANDKYSAIFTHHDTCLEYRIFDTCYRQVNRMRVFLNTICETLKFYSDKPKHIPSRSNIYLEQGCNNGWSEWVYMFNGLTNLNGLCELLKEVHPNKKLVIECQGEIKQKTIDKKTLLEKLSKITYRRKIICAD